MHPPVPRTWTVELRPQHGGPALYCPRCSPHGQALQATSARPAALAHLARHARSDALPAHLRTCQCHERGCRWHPRHRGCAGPVLLVLTREHGGRTWRLADICASCATATPNAAVVPDTTLTAPSAQHPSEDGPGSGRGKRARRRRGPSEQVRVQDMLSYLASALPVGICPEARLLAVQCALRADNRGQVRMPIGLLRSLRLAHDPALWTELEQHCWLRVLQPGTTLPHVRTLTAQLIDPLSRAPGRPDRLQAADWALRITAAAPLRALPANARLSALALAAHHSPGHARTGVEADRLRRACGLHSSGLGTLLDQLLAAGTLTSWTCDPATDELHWTPSQPTTRPHPTPAPPVCPGD
ncbi:hypothetical protein [Streptomyces sp. NBC_01750]|uniref:hypothetical protein n=1 Tax=Streptomyces sp. NBC_01750 TaxID=2975928 RepID=UPI002DDA0698|nr:hypothetical protein [Streptomyces sp. NBC_01750]WSD30587.1 hypothetical protein OG966_00465 [Streptomyces sp. NBC_01750]